MVVFVCNTDYFRMAEVKAVYDNRSLKELLLEGIDELEAIAKMVRSFLLNMAGVSA